MGTLLRRTFLISLGILLAGFFGMLIFLAVVSPCIGACAVAAPDESGLSGASGTPASSGQAPGISGGTALDPPGEPGSSGPSTTPGPSLPLPSKGPFVYSFNTYGTLRESSRQSDSSSPYWFLDSGGELWLTGGVGETVHGSLPLSDRWRTAYARNNPRDTDDGLHPQNIFRLVTKRSWEDASVSLYFRIDGDNLSESEYRNASNGLLLMSRYRDHDSLYYAGIRVDGTAIIKKKYAGTYYTMKQAPLFPGSYDRSVFPNLLPHDVWLGLKVETRENADGSVAISLFLARPGTSEWSLVLSATDDGKAYSGTPPITGAGLVGVRTDFMDVSFKDFRVTPL